MQKLAVRYIIFTLGLYFLSLGLVLFVKSSLGTTPISSMNYVISVNSPLTLGTTTFLFNLALILIQLWLVKGRGTRKDLIEILLQIPFSFLMAVFIDANMSMLWWLQPNSYPVALTVLAAGCLIQAFGVALEIKPDVVAMSAEGTVKYAARRFGLPFGKMKVWFDLTLVAAAAVLSLSLSGQLQGLREGTAIGALCTGYIVSFFLAHLSWLSRFIRKIPESSHQTG